MSKQFRKYFNITILLLYDVSAGVIAGLLLYVLLAVSKIIKFVIGRIRRYRRRKDEPCVGVVSFIPYYNEHRRDPDL